MQLTSTYTRQDRALTDDDFAMILQHIEAKTVFWDIHAQNFAQLLILEHMTGTPCPFLETRRSDTADFAISKRDSYRMLPDVTGFLARLVPAEYGAFWQKLQQSFLEAGSKTSDELPACDVLNDVMQTVDEFEASRVIQKTKRTRKKL